jgi:hypothetical protein
MIRQAATPSSAELDSLAQITPSDIALAVRVGDRDVPRLRPAFHAVLIDPELDPGPSPDETT